MEETINVQQLSKSFKLSSKQENLVRALLTSDDMELEESKCRDKLKLFIKPYKGVNFQKELKTLEEKNLVLIGYDKEGRRIIRMSPVNKINERINTVIPNKAVPIVLREENNKKQPGTRVTKDVIQRIKEMIKDMLSSSPDKWMFSKDVHDAIKLSEPTMAKMTYKRIIDSLVSEKAIEYRNFSYSSRGKNSKKIITLLQNIVEPKQNEITIKINENDYMAVEKSLGEFHITSDPKKWLSDLLDDNIIYLLNNKSLAFNVLLNEDMWNKCQFLKENFKDLGSDMNQIISKMVCEFIDKEYIKRYSTNEFNSIMSQVNDKECLESFKALLEKKINDISSPSPKK